MELFLGIIFVPASKGILLQKIFMCAIGQGIINYLALAWQKKLFPHVLIMRGMTFEFEYHSEFKLIFENNLG